jgi:hypothetical protein
MGAMMGSAVVLAALALAGAGCYSSPKNGFDEAVAAGERPVAMKGEGAFFGGKLGAVITLSRGVGSGVKNSKFRPPDVHSALNSADDQKDAEAYLAARMEIGSPLAPITIRLILENRTQQVLKIEIVEMNSDLGNFAVQPDSLLLNAGQQSEPNPMISQLGVTSDQIPFTVTLTVGNKTETQTIVVKDLPGANLSP